LRHGVPAGGSLFPLSNDERPPIRFSRTTPFGSFSGRLAVSFGVFAGAPCRLAHSTVHMFSIRSASVTRTPVLRLKVGLTFLVHPLDKGFSRGFCYYPCDEPRSAGEGEEMALSMMSPFDSYP